MKAIIETNVINDDIVRKCVLFPAKDAKKNLQKGYDVKILFGKRIEGSADNALFLWKFHGLASSNDGVGKSFLKEIFESHLKVGKKSSRLWEKAD